MVFLVLLADQLLKYWVKMHMSPYSFEPNNEIQLFGNWGKLHFTENNGIAFGYEFAGRSGKLALTLFRIIAAGLLCYYTIRVIKSKIGRGFAISVALIFAGAVGNIIDSVFYGKWFYGLNDYEGGYFHGKVVDMLYFPVLKGYFPKWLPLWGGEDYEFFRPIFNIADASISVGVLMILIFFRKSLKS
ncbi:MAG: lipoprotein signal peptidase [Bacteroidetes bacterium]|nr:lipoprotein signal peptidase [Bacteroidota bacterium]